MRNNIDTKPIKYKLQTFLINMYRHIKKGNILAIPEFYIALRFNTPKY
jgi:hypothetical protein